MAEQEMLLEGLHPTTVSCMEAMQNLRTRAFTNVLDMGCGNGLLGVLAAHWWKAQVTAADISAQAVSDTLVMAQTHGVNVRGIRSDGFSDASILRHAPYDLILFNLLAEPLVRLAPQVKSHITPGGICVVSGILSWLEAEVISAYEALGFTLLGRVAREPWRTLVWQEGPTFS